MDQGTVASAVSGGASEGGGSRGGGGKRGDGSGCDRGHSGGPEAWAGCDLQAQGSERCDQHASEGGAARVRYVALFGVADALGALQGHQEALEDRVHKLSDQLAVAANGAQRVQA